MFGRVRAAWDALRGYAAAQDSRASAWAASGGSANSEVASGAATIARRAREAVRNVSTTLIHPGSEFKLVSRPSAGIAQGQGRYPAFVPDPAG